MSYSIRNGALIICAANYYNDRDKFFEWLANHNNEDGTIVTLCIYGKMCLSHLLTFIQEIGLLIVRKDTIKEIELNVTLKRPQFDNQRRLRNILSEYVNLTGITLTSPNLWPCLNYLEETQLSKITKLNIVVNYSRLTLEYLLKFTNLKDLSIRHNELIGRFTNPEIYDKLLKMKRLSITVSLYRLLLEPYRDYNSTNNIEELALFSEGDNHDVPETLAKFFTTLTSVKRVSLAMHEYEPIIPMLNNCPKLEDLTINNTSIITLYVCGKCERNTNIIDTIIANTKDKPWKIDQIKITEQKYEMIQKLVDRGINIEKVLNPSNYAISRTLVQHGYKLNNICFAPIMKQATSLSDFKYRFRITNHFSEQIDRATMRSLLNEKCQQYLDKIDL